MNVTTKRDMLDMFLDRTVDESYSSNRLTTQRSESGNVALIAYNWLELAEYNESRNVVTVFTGHTDLRSQTVSGYLNDVASRAKDRGREVVLSGESPVVDTPNSGVRFVKNYVSMDGSHSAQEQEAIDEVVSSLA